MSRCVTSPAVSTIQPEAVAQRFELPFRRHLFLRRADAHQARQLVAVHHHRLAQVKRRVVRLHRHAGQQICQRQLFVGQAGIFAAEHQRGLADPLLTLTQLFQQLRRRAVVVKTRAAAGGGGDREVYIRQRLFQRGERLHAVEDLAGPVCHPACSRLQVRLAVDDAQRSEAHGFHRARRRADVFRPRRSH